MSTPSKVPSPSKQKRSSAGGDPSEKRRKMVTEPPEDPPTEAPKSQQLFNRLFSQEDEIKLLNAFLDICKTTNAFPLPPNTASLIFDKVGDSFAFRFTSRQLADKLRKLRGKYAKQSNNETTLKSSHDWEVFRLSQKIWGEDSARPSDLGGSSAKDPQNEKRKVDSPVENREGEKENRARASETENGEVEMEAHDSPAENGGEAVTVPVYELALEKFSFLMQEFCRLPWDAVLRDGLGSLDESVLKRLNEEWRLQHIAEAKIMAKRAHLLHEHTKLILDSVDISPAN